MPAYPEKWTKTEVSPYEFELLLTRAFQEILTRPDDKLADSIMPNSTVKHYLEQATLFYKEKAKPGELDHHETLRALVANLRDAVFNFANEIPDGEEP